MINSKFPPLNVDKFPGAHNKFKANKKLRRVFRTIGNILCIVMFSLVAVLAVSICIVSASSAIYINDYKTNEAIHLEDYSEVHSNSVIYSYNSNGEPVVMQELQGEENRIWVTINEIPQNMQKAIIAIEDERFYSHNGIDWKRTAGAFVNMFASIYSTEQGGSTITQQLIKNLTGNDATTVERKFNEIFQALDLEKNYSKTEILEMYLNEIYLSNNCYGVQAAALKYFNKNISELNLAECATIAVITNAPSYYDPIYNFENNQEKKEYCLHKMLETGAISKKEYDDAMSFKVEIYDHSSDESAKPTGYFSYYTDFVIETVINDLMDEYGYSYQKAKSITTGGGLKIYSAIDTSVQAAIDDIYVNRKGGFMYVNDDELQSAMVVMEYDGRVVGIVGGAGEKNGSLSYSRATHARRSPGSSMKPLAVYSYGIEYNRITWSSLTLDYAINFNGSRYPNNTDGTYGTGKMVTTQYAICHSTNTVAVRLAQEFTVKECFDFVQRAYHISTFTPSDEVLSAVALGGMSHGVTVLEMCAAYQTFGNGGVYNPPYCYYKVTDSNGKIILNHTSNPQTAISADTAWVMNKLMQTVTNPNYMGTGYKFGLGAYGIETFAKSGSTTDYCDVWFCGGSPYYVTAVWTGYDYLKPINVWAGNTSGFMWNSVMSAIHKNLEPATFTPSASVVQLEYCTISGMIAGEYCMSRSTGWYKVSHTGNVCTTCGSWIWGENSQKEKIEVETE